MGNVGARFWKQSTRLALCSYNTTGLIMDSFKAKCWNRYSRTRDITFFIRILHYPQCNSATEWHHWRQFIRIHAYSSRATKDFVQLFNICHQWFSPRPANTLSCIKLVELTFKSRAILCEICEVLRLKCIEMYIIFYHICNIRNVSISNLITPFFQTLPEYRYFFRILIMESC